MRRRATELERELDRRRARRGDDGEPTQIVPLRSLIRFAWEERS
jgi:hypothetical protein